MMLHSVAIDHVRDHIIDFLGDLGQAAEKRVELVVWNDAPFCTEYTGELDFFKDILAITLQCKHVTRSSSLTLRSIIETNIIDVHSK